MKEEIKKKFTRIFRYFKITTDLASEKNVKKRENAIESDICEWNNILKLSTRSLLEGILVLPMVMFVDMVRRYRFLPIMWNKY